MDNKTVFIQIDLLIDSWCEKRKLCCLRRILQYYPLSNTLTDDWGNLLNSLKDIKHHCKDEITEKDIESLNILINEIEPIVYRKM
jgi:hypothetical protein